LAAPVRIAVDGMGGDFGPRLAFEACCIFLVRQPNVEINFYVADSFVAPTVIPARIRIVYCPQAVLPADSPQQVVRRKRDSSMGQALDALRSGAVSACLSSGNTGGLVMLAAHILGMQAGVHRPVLCTKIPTRTGSTWLLDLGGVLTPDAVRLLEYAHLGAQQAARSLRRRVRVGLLNIGREAHKGTDVVRQAAELLAVNTEFDYVGFIEPSGIFAGDADVVVCDGLSGNLVLKSAEAAAATVLSILRSQFKTNPWRLILAWLCEGVFRQVRDQLHPAQLNGAHLLGVNGLVVKSHGSADTEAFVAALTLVYRAAGSP
jgi:phosphate acyltransferase